MITDYRKAYQEELNKEKELGKTINSQLIEIADLKNKLISGELVYKDLRDSSNTEIAELQDKLHRRNMQIKELKKIREDLSWEIVEKQKQIQVLDKLSKNKDILFEKLEKENQKLIEKLTEINLYSKHPLKILETFSRPINTNNP